ncbi:MAG TPA: hypothetical protein VF033_15650 [Steroidobacteraceae bacterium]
MNSIPATTPRLARASPRVEYRRLASGQDVPDDALFIVDFTRGRAGPGRVCVALEPLAGAGLSEVWFASGAVASGETQGVRYRHDDHFLAGVIEVDEAQHGGIAPATAAAYRAIAEFQSAAAFPHLLRTWNYFDAINDGVGDAERYRSFCGGRVAGLAALRQVQHPAATVIGRRAREGVLQVYWLAGRVPGMALENPRQVSAYLYPREYGATAPTFSRAMLVTPHLLLVSGTASIVGHASRHCGDAGAQTREILVNLDSLLARARQYAPTLPDRIGERTLIKAYVRDASDLPVVEAELRERLPPEAPLLVLHGDVCRRDLLVEFDCLASADG